MSLFTELIGLGVREGKFLKKGIVPMNPVVEGAVPKADELLYAYNRGNVQNAMSGGAHIALGEDPEIVIAEVAPSEQLIITEKLSQEEFEARVIELVENIEDSLIVNQGEFLDELRRVDPDRAQKIIDELKYTYAVTYMRMTSEGVDETIVAARALLSAKSIEVQLIDREYGILKIAKERIEKALVDETTSHAETKEQLDRIEKFFHEKGYKMAEGAYKYVKDHKDQIGGWFAGIVASIIAGTAVILGRETYVRLAGKEGMSAKEASDTYREMLKELRKIDKDLQLGLFSKNKDGKSIGEKRVDRKKVKKVVEADLDI